MKHEFELQSLVKITIEAETEGIAQQEIFRRLDEDYFDIELRRNCIVLKARKGDGSQKVQVVTKETIDTNSQKGCGKPFAQLTTHCNRFELCPECKARKENGK